LISAPRLKPRLKPQRPRRGDRLSLVAPSGSAKDADRVRDSAAALASLGFEVKVSPHCADACGYLAGADEARAADLEAAFLDPETSGVVCLKGGYGTPRILDRIDYRIVAEHPKPFLGYSDITALHLAFRLRAGLVTLHGPMPSSDMVPDFHPDSRASLEDLLFGTRYPCALSNPDGSRLETMVGGRAEGELSGGNLSLLAATMGTPWQIEPEGKILFIEDVDEAPYRIDRMLNQLRLAGVFDACEGVVFGAFTRCEAGEGKRSLSLREIVDGLVAPSGKPILFGLEAGHCVPSLSLPLGTSCLLDADSGSLTILESPFSD
jgi:muramoyltetrapeptide carboxypeptidase